MPVALSPIVQENVKHLVATGAAKKDIAKDLDISSKSVSRIAERFREEIETISLQLIDESKDLIKSNHITTLKLSNKALQLANSVSTATEWQQLKGLSKRLDMIGLQAKDLLQLGDKKEYRTLQIMGIIPSNTPSIIINQLLQQSVTVLNPEVQALLGHKFTGLDEDIVDVDEVDSTRCSEVVEGDNG